MEKVKAVAVLGTSFMSAGRPPLPSTGAAMPPSWNAPVHPPPPVSEPPAFSSPPAFSTPQAPQTPQTPQAQVAPSIPTFDPTAALDEASEKIVTQGIRSFLPHATVILITHRRQLAELADTVLDLG